MTSLAFHSFSACHYYFMNLNILKNEYLNSFFFYKNIYLNIDIYFYEFIIEFLSRLYIQFVYDFDNYMNDEELDFVLKSI
jgi:hypothetical protein